MMIAWLITIVVLCGASTLPAQTRTVAELANYRGADREEMLKAGAKKEGKLTWYTSLTAHRDIANVFEAKYPGVKVETYRAAPNDLTRRLLTEAQSKRSIADLLETTPTTLMIMRDNKLLAPYSSPHLANYPDDSKEEADKSRVYWVTDRESIVGLGYNRNMMRAADVPKSFGDFAKPENKGKIGVSGDTTGVRFIGAMIAAKGEEYVKQLRSLEIRAHMISGGAMHELMAAGEMPMSISIFRNHVLAGKLKGAPTEWVPLDLSPANAGSVGLPAASNSPHGALLFIDFLLSPEGQKIFEDKFRFATSTKNYGFKRWYPEKGKTLEQYEKAEERWKKLLQEIIVRR
jgi:iron(III) transport system substrate-binding protein